MRDNDEFIGQVEDYLVEFDGITPLPARVIDTVHAELPRTRQAKAGPGFMRMPAMPSTISTRAPWGIAAFAKLGMASVAIVVSAAAGLTLLRPPAVGPATSALPTGALGTLEPVASPIACGHQYGVLGCSRDGTRLLIQNADGNLVVVHADGSETQVTEQLPRLDGYGGNGLPSGATISPDGSRVVFPGVTTRAGSSCHNGALFAVGADGGPAELLWKSQAAEDGGIVGYPTFSPDGTQLAFADGYCDSNHSVWVMNADGSDAHQVVTLGDGHVRGLAWSPAGDRLALWLQGFDAGEGTRIYTFATDGSGFTQGGDASGFCWPGRRCPAAVGPETLPSPTAALGTSEPVAGPVDCGIQGLETGTVLGCSRDGRRLLIQKSLDGSLFLMDADGSETQVTDQLSGFNQGAGSSRPTGATISPDGSRVVFAGLTKQAIGSCHDGALFAVDADGGQAELLWESHVPQNGIVRDPMFSPDGTQIAFADGYCDSSHSVWVMNPDGSDAHRIVGPLGDGDHVEGLAWSPAGDRIALRFREGAIYTVATDGSDLTTSGDTSEFCWPGSRC